MYIATVCDPEQAKKIFRNYYSDLFAKLLSPDIISAVAPKLYSEKLISEESLDNIDTLGKTGYEKANSLLRALRSTISTKPHSLKTLIEVLKKHDLLEVIADKMEQEASYIIITMPS